MAKKRKGKIKKVRIERKIKRQAAKTRKSIPRQTERQKRIYQALLRDYVAKQNQLGYPETNFTASRSAFFKKMRRELKRGGELIKKGRKEEGDKLIIKALKETIRRDGIADFILPGESPNAGQSLAA